MKRWIRRGALALAALLVLAVGAGWWLLRGSVPALDGDAPLAGLAAAAMIERDARGVVTITAGSERDAMRALGWVHAQERYFEMDLLRRTAAGELAALFGPIAVDTDKRHRVHRLRARVEAQLARIAGPEAPVLDAYADGVNTGLAALRTRPWPYLLLRQRPAAWRTEDTPLVGYAMYFDLQDAGNARELALARMQPHMPPALFALLTRDGTQWDAPMMGAARGDAPLPGSDVLDLRALPAPASKEIARRAERGTPGSNSFAVAGSRTRDGRAIVADDMHLGLRAPNIWFRARLRYPDARAPGGRVDVSGFTLPGIPGVIVGSNTRVAWGFTNSYGDWMDFRRVACADAACGGRTVRERIEVAGGEPVTLDVAETEWGPVLRRDGDTGYALRWAAHLPGSLNFGLTRFARADSLDAMLASARDAGVPAQNLVAGDASGRIAWRVLGAFPQRGADCAPTLTTTAAAADDCAPWSLAPVDAPRIVDPASGRLWTANARIADGAALAAIGDGGYALGARQRQIRDRLFAQDTFDERALLSIQLDDRAVFLARWHTLLRAQADHAKTPAVRALADAAARWDGRALPSSVSYRLVRAWRLAVHERIADGLVAPARAALGDDFTMPDLPQLEGVAWPLLMQRPPHLLPRRYACSPVIEDNRPGCAIGTGWDALLEDAAAQVGDDLAKDGPLAERTWGERNTARICHPLAGAIPLIGRRALCMPAQALPGDGSMPRVQGPAFGASQRMVVSPGREADGIAHMPGGQSGHPLSPFWGVGHDDWVQGRPSPFLPQATAHTLTLSPASAR